MKHALKRKTLCILMALMILLVSVPNAAWASSQSRSDPYFHIYGVSLSTSSSGALHMVFSVTAKDFVEMVGVSHYRVQRKVNGQWSNVTGLLSGELHMNTVTCSFSRSFSEAVSGVQYRVYALLYIRAFDGTVRTIDYYSQSYTLK